MHSLFCYLSKSCKHQDIWKIVIIIAYIQTHTIHIIILIIILLNRLKLFLTRTALYSLPRVLTDIL